MKEEPSSRDLSRFITAYRRESDYPMIKIDDSHREFRARLCEEVTPRLAEASTAFLTDLLWSEAAYCSIGAVPYHALTRIFSELLHRSDFDPQEKLGPQFAKMVYRDFDLDCEMRASLKMPLNVAQRLIGQLEALGPSSDAPYNGNPVSMALFILKAAERRALKSQG
jgi:hypothetical protein